MLSDDYFNKHFSRLAVLKELSTIIEYIGLLFAVQIPVFILLLEKYVTQRISDDYPFLMLFIFVKY